jgi:MFS family permease
MSARSSWLPELPRDAWRLLAGESLSALGCGLTLPFLLVYLHEVRGLGLAAAGLAMSCLAAVGFLANPLGGALSDRAGARSTLVTGLLAAAGGALALTAVREPWHVFGATALLGMGAGLVLPSQQALLAGLAGEESLSAAFSLRHLALNLGLGAGSTAGALLVDVSAPGSFELVYMVQASAMAGFAAIVLSVPEPGPKAGAKEGSVGRGAYRAVLGDRRLRRLLPLVTLLFAAGYSQYETAFPAYATGEGDIESSALGAAFAANTFTVVAAQLVALRAVRGWPRSHALALTGCAWAAAWGIALAAGALGGTAAAIGFCLSMIVFGLGETLLAPTLGPLVNEWAPDELRGRYNGACAFACTGGYVLGPAVASALLGAALGAVLIAGLMTACALAALAALTLDVERPARAAGPAGTRPVMA